MDLSEIKEINFNESSMHSMTENVCEYEKKIM